MTDEKKRRSDWLKILYTETLKQYAHEEQMSQSKNTFYISTNGALLALITGMAGVLFKLSPYNFNEIQFHFNGIIIGIIVIIFSIAAININKSWKHVNAAHRTVQNLRWVVAHGIEHEEKITNIGLASIEHNHTMFKPKHKDIPFVPFPHNSNLQHKIAPRQKLRGYNSIEYTINALNKTWKCFIILGIGSILLPIIHLFIQLYK